MRNTKIFLVLAFIPFLCSFNKSDALILNYIDTYSVIAIQEMNRTGIPASITLAQGIIESRYGMSGLAKNSNNHFGIKCNNNWAGGKYYHKDDDYVNGKLVKSCFRTYTTAAESYYDHSAFLMVNKRYAFLFKLEKSDYKGWAKGLKKAGYATATHYATSLIKTIEQYELYKYDKVTTPLLAKEERINKPKAEKIGDNYLNFSVAATASTTQTYAEVLVAQAPPQPTALPINYKPGDGYKKVQKQERRNFHEDVYGVSSNKYLDVITPQTFGQD